MRTLLAPPILDDISRRGLLTGLGAAGLLTACSTGSVTPSMAATREVVDGTGRTVVIPADPQRILVLAPCSNSPSCSTSASPRSPYSTPPTPSTGCPTP